MDSRVTLLVGVLALGPATYAAEPQRAAEPPRTPRTPRALEAHGQLPLAFVPNAGQTDVRVRYLAQAPGATFYFTPSEAVIAFAKGEKGLALHLAFLGANAAPELAGIGQESGRVNYLIGRDSARWRTGLPTYGEVVYRDLWPGIDLAFRGGKDELKYEFRLAPGADPRDIRLAYRGAERLSVGRAGELRIQTALGVLRDSRPVSYQTVAGRRVPVASRYALAGAGYGFALGAYDRSRPLVIDPGLVYSTYLGGTSGVPGSTDDSGESIAVDSLGNAYVTGFTSAFNFPTTPGAFDPTDNGSSDAFVTKLNAAGTALVYSTYLGGSGGDRGQGIAVDLDGNAYLTGETTASDFPTTAGAFDTTHNGGFDAYVTKLDATGAALLYSTYLGTSAQDQALAIAVDHLGNACVTGLTRSATFPTTEGAFDRTGDAGGDPFVTKLDASGAMLVYSTYLGGSLGFDQGLGIAVDPEGNAYVTGEAQSANFPTTPGAFDTTHNGGRFDAFVTKLGPMGALVYSTYLGGGGDEESGQGIAVDALGNAYVAGVTNSINFPATPGAFDTSFNGGFRDAFVTKLDATGATLAWSTYLGGAGDDDGFGIAVDSAGRAYVTGFTRSQNFPTTPGAFDTTPGAGQAVFVTKLDATGGALAYSTYLGVDDLSLGLAIAADPLGHAYVTGRTGSGIFPTTPGAFDRARTGNTDAFVTKLDMVGAPAALALTPATATNSVGTSHTVTAFVEDATGQPVANVIVRFTVTGAVTTSGPCTTDADGQCDFSYPGPTAPGSDAITAFADTDGDSVQDPGEPGDAADKTWAPAAPATVVLTPETDTNPAGTSHTVTATVTDAFDNPVPGVSVRFTVAGANSATDAATTDEAGNAAFSYTGTHAGDDSITAYADADQDGSHDPEEPSGGPVAKTWVPAAPATVVLTPATRTNPVGTSHTVTAAVADAFANQVAGAIVRFTVTGSVSASGPCTTDASGQCAFTYPGPTVPGSDAIAAFADTDGDGLQDPDEPSGGPVTKTWVPGAPAMLVLMPATDTNPVATSHVVTATVTDSFANGVPAVTVRITITGSVSTSGQCASDPNGQCSFTYQGPTTPGSDAIRAYADTDGDGVQGAGEPSGGPVAKTWVPGAPATLVLTPPTAINPVGTSHTVTAAVADAFANQVPGAIIRFTVTGSVSASGQCTTDASGQCAFTYPGPTVPGSDAIAAFADTDGDGVQDAGEPSGGPVNKTWVPAGPATVVLVPATATNPVGTSHTVTATVTDAFGNPVPETMVRFTVAGAHSAAGAGTTDPAGHAPFSYTGAQAGADIITAYADTDQDGSRDPDEPGATATKVWVGGTAAIVTVTPSADSNPVSTEHCVTATVTGAFGDPVSGVTVRFTVVGAVDAHGEAPTDANGEATFCYMGPDLPGADEIRAHADSDDDGVVDAGEAVGGATKTWLLPAATPGHVTGGGHAPTLLGIGEIAFGFNAKSTDSDVKGHCNVVDRTAHVHVKCLDVTSLVRDGTRATIFGPGTINGVPMTYRIDVDDQGEPGRGRDTFNIMTDSDYRAGGILAGGNVQVR